MSESIIPKEKLSAFQRWEMASFDPPPPPPPAPEIDPLAVARAAAEAQGFAAGRQAGLAEGYAAGHAEGLAAGHALARENAARLAELADAFTAAADALSQEVAEALGAAAMDIAHSVVRQALQTDPTVVLGAARELLDSEPPLLGAPVLLVNPADLPVVDAYLAGDLAAAGWSVRSDITIARGDCRAKAGSGEIDATLATRWTRVVTALGKDRPW
ncbi:flagellar assembly protein FliH [Chitinasiproducens palmae]|uniref:Flagellar assembly protein FliH n=1 Tax=Chitinasiproducens palmae TaxID=1770053 RepID=A0A1H2PJQ4_9BURK|nr:flagellar assembly protein FliH [Chitinasiproducens palmae]SDV46583.1 flagellar assembly protein FliH [Chitinasiproducens palmae]